MTFRVGAITSIPEDAVTFVAKKTFLLAQPALIYATITFKWSPSQSKAYFQPCDFNPDSNVEVDLTQEEIDAMTLSGWIGPA